MNGGVATGVFSNGKGEEGEIKSESEYERVIWSKRVVFLIVDDECTGRPVMVQMADLSQISLSPPRCRSSMHTTLLPMATFMCNVFVCNSLLLYRL